MYSTAYMNFTKNISSVDDLLELYSNIIDTNPDFKNKAGEILRASIVITVSALDNFMHDFYRTEIIENYLGGGNFDVKFENLQISINGMKMIDSAISIDEKRNVLINEMRKIQRTETYQSPKSIEYIFKNLNVVNIWQKLSDVDTLGFSAGDLKLELSNIIDRRNKISHESDWDFINERKYPITKPNVEAVLNFVKSLVSGINNINVI